MKALEDLEAWYRECPGALVAFSGGVDSSLVAFLSRHFLGNDQVLAVISASPSLKLCDLEEARHFAGGIDLPLKVIATQEMENPNYFENPANRCYFCKHTLYDALVGLAEDYPDWWILNGTNSEDAQDYRPGLKAAEAFRVRSPLVDCEVDKQAVRALAKRFNLVCWDKPASPCLSSRVPYGERITVEKLRQIEAAEALVAKAGFRVNRVRHHGEIARVEVEQGSIVALKAMQSALRKSILALGFRGVEFDAEGFVSGKLNRALSSSAERQPE